MPTQYPIRAVAKLTGISLDTLRAWERRYQAVTPEHSDRGRMYRPSDIARLQLLNQLVQRGHAIGGVAALSDKDLRKLLGAPPEAATVPRTEDVIAPVLDAIDNFDATRAGDELSRLATLLAPRELIYQMVLPLMQEVGSRWHSGVFGIAQEHMVSHILRNLLGGMLRHFRPANAPVKMVLATPQGEAHEFGILASSMLASVAGIEPVYLGSDLPAREIARAAQRVSARVVLLGVTIVGATTADEVAKISSALSRNTEVWIGGAGSGDLDLSKLRSAPVLLKDLPGLEQEFRRWRN